MNSAELSSRLHEQRLNIAVAVPCDRRSTAGCRRLPPPTPPFAVCGFSSANVPDEWPTPKENSRKVVRGLLGWFDDLCLRYPRLVCGVFRTDL
jgi:hypothetical protein